MVADDQPHPPDFAKAAGKGRKKDARKRQLRIVFDTNVLYTGSASELVRQEVATLIQQSRYRDLDVGWYLPEIVRHERQYQMQKRAVELLPSIEKLERLLGHNLNITKEILLDRVSRTVQQRLEELRLSTLDVDYSSVDWSRLALDAVYRRPPFEAGESEKGFRDALVAETFMRLVADSPKKAEACRVVLITGDKLLREAVEARVGNATNVRVVADVAELKELINALASEVEEAFVTSLRERAANMFFRKKDETSLYYGEKVRDRMTNLFKTELEALPQGATGRKNGTWRISLPNFFKKVRQRVHWVSRIQVEAEGTKQVFEGRGRWGASSSLVPLSTVQNPVTSVMSSNPFTLQVPGVAPPKETSGISVTVPNPLLRGLGSPPSVLVPTEWPPSLGQQLLEAAQYRTVLTHKGVDVFEVYWSVGVTTSLALRKPSIDDIVHVEAVWEPVG